MRISDWSSDVCSSVLCGVGAGSVLTRVSLAQALLAQAQRALHQRGVAGEGAEEGELSSEERRVGKECVRTCRYRRLSCNLKKTIPTYIVRFTSSITSIHF